MHTGPDGVLHLRVPARDVAGWVLLLVVLAAGGLADLRWGSGAVAVACLVVVVLLGATVVPPMVSLVSAYPEGHLTIWSPLGTARWEMEQIDAVVVTSTGPEGESTWPLERFRGPALPFVRGAELVLFSGVDVPLRCTQVIPLPPLRRRLDRQVAALQAWLAEGPA